MKTFKATLKSASPYSQSKFINVDKEPKESADDYEKRTWNERLHATPDGFVFIPPMAFKNCLSEAAKYLSIQIPGKGKATYTKHFEAGLMIMDPVVLGIKKSDVPGEWLHVPSDGRRGGTKRVTKKFPIIHEWDGDLIVHVLDETITGEVLRQHLEQAGKFIGVGRFRPRNNGYYGRFDLVDFQEV
jgi:hypothetical protein